MDNLITAIINNDSNQINNICNSQFDIFDMSQTNVKKSCYSDQFLKMCYLIINEKNGFSNKSDLSEFNKVITDKFKLFYLPFGDSIEIVIFQINIDNYYKLQKNINSLVANKPLINNIINEQIYLLNN